MRLDIAIAGCGPAGLAAALLLHRAGHHVHIFERFAQPRPVGSGLIIQPAGMAVLEELGVGSALRALAAPLERLWGLSHGSRNVALAVQYQWIGKGVTGFGLHRAALFGTLHEAAVRQKIEITAGVAIASFDEGNERPSILDADGRYYGPFDLVVDALGAHSPLASGRNGAGGVRALPFGALWATLPFPAQGFDRSILEQRYEQAHRMAGVLPIGRLAPNGDDLCAFFWSLKAADLQAWKQRGLKVWKDEVRALWPEAETLLNHIHSPEQLTFASYGHRTMRRPFGRRLVHIGDAAHCTSPQLGQGANMALLDALALARAIESHAELANALEDYAAMRRWHVRIFQAASAIFTPFYQSDSAVLPFLRDFVAAPLSRLPVARSLLARLVAGEIVAPLAGEQFRPWRRPRRLTLPR